MIQKDNTVVSFPANNVILFPKQNSKTNDLKSPSIEDVQNNMKMAKHYHIQEAIANIAPIIFNQFEVCGFNFSEEEEDNNLKSGAFIVESIRSMLCEYYGLYHPFQQLSDAVFIPDGEDEGSLRIVESLNISLVNEKSK
jgi:hypothetical protein